MKNFKHMILAGAVATVFAGSAVAAEVGQVTTFTSGTPAVAAEVNANFQALISAINDNNSRIATLEAAQAASDSVSGRYYKLRDMGWIMAAHRVGQTQDMPVGDYSVQDGFARIGFYHGNLDIHFNANGTFTLTGADFDAEMFVNSSSEIGAVAADVSETGTWVQDGHDVTLTFTAEQGQEPEVFPLTASKGAQILNANDGNLREITQDEFAPTVYLHEYEGSFLIGIEVDAPLN